MIVSTRGGSEEEEEALMVEQVKREFDWAAGSTRGLTLCRF